MTMAIFTFHRADFSSLSASSKSRSVTMWTMRRARSRSFSEPSALTSTSVAVGHNQDHLAGGSDRLGTFCGLTGHRWRHTGLNADESWIVDA
jgi:hypothetical protein